ncbi:hypothetical protein NA57DRAFT_56951 [Rhizodiscina lignyota]|uniref:Uncharacterized protein n=1 Tax=Rhizodiscina lignyota TaxID=1504668 RepID=A0A9P4M584_9PEZI|nr:hypothetical protein NA57DRAFT_56951 [Rhizodiscina lignyota]
MAPLIIRNEIQESEVSPAQAKQLEAIVKPMEELYSSIADDEHRSIRMTADDGDGKVDFTIDLTINSYGNPLFRAVSGTPSDMSGKILYVHPDDQEQYKMIMHQLPADLHAFNVDWGACDSYSRAPHQAWDPYTPHWVNKAEQVECAIMDAGLFELGAYINVLSENMDIILNVARTMYSPEVIAPVAEIVERIKEHNSKMQGLEEWYEQWQQSRHKEAFAVM